MRRTSTDTESVYIDDIVASLARWGGPPRVTSTLVTPLDVADSDPHALVAYIPVHHCLSTSCVVLHFRDKTGSV